jgi:hypothetical protein
MKEITTINGPLNLFRLEGEVNNIKKVLYLFGDIHNNVVEQTECDDPESLDIHQYIFRSLKNNNKTLDFFMETRIAEKTFFDNNEKMSYIQQMEKVFHKHFKINQDTKKIVKSEKYNMRFHMFDYRGIFKFIIIYFHYFPAITELWASLINNSTEQKFNSLIKNLVTVKNLLDRGIKIMLQTIKNKKIYSKTKINIFSGFKNNNYDETYDYEKVSYLIHKFYYKYENKELSKKLNPIMLNEINKLVNLINKLQKIINILKESRALLLYPDNKLNKDTNVYGKNRNAINKIDDDFLKKFNSCSQELLTIGVKITDLFFIKRILDKDYIKNVIAYTGFHHTFNYILILVQLFNFKITHTTPKNHNLDKINTRIKSIENFEDLGKYFLPEISTQCIDIKDFPDNFN